MCEPVEPDFYIFEKLEPGQDPGPVVRTAYGKQRERGCKFGRATLADGGVWIEGWLEVPARQAEFNPPRTYAEAALGSAEVAPPTGGAP